MGLVRIFTYVYHKDQPNVGNNTIHGWYGWCNKSSSILESSKGKRVDKPGTARKPMTFHPWEEWREQFFLCGLGKKIPWNVWRMWRTYRNFFNKKKQKWPRFENRKNRNRRGLVSFGLSRAGCTGSHHLSNDQAIGCLALEECHPKKNHYMSTWFHFIYHIMFFIYNPYHPWDWYIHLNE